MLEQRLIVIQPNPLDSEERGGDATEARRAHETFDERLDPPQIARLQKRAAVRVARFERTLLAPQPGCTALDRRPEPVDLGA